MLFMTCEHSIACYVAVEIVHEIRTRTWR